MVELYRKVLTGMMQSAALGYLSAIIGTYGYQFSQTPTVRSTVIIVAAALLMVIVGSLLAQKLRELRAQLS